MRRRWLGVALLAGAACSHPMEGTKAPEPPAVEVAATRPERQAIARAISLSAGVEAFEQAPLYARVAGYVESVAVDLGDRVTEGQILATLEVPELTEQSAQAEQQLARAQAEATLQRSILTRSEGLRAKDAITDQDLDEARARAAKAGAELRLAAARVSELQTLGEYASVRAPFAGIVTRRFVDRGALVQASTSSNSPLVTVARIETVRVFADVPEPEVSFVGREDRAVLEVAALPGQRFTGHVTRFAVALDPASRTMRTEVDFANPDGALRPGMYGTLTIALETHPDALTVPEAAVRREKTRALVYVIDGDHAVERAVKAGFAADGRVEIVDGLADGETVIASGLASVADGVRVRVAEAAP